MTGLSSSCARGPRGHADHVVDELPGADGARIGPLCTRRHGSGRSSIAFWVEPTRSGPAWAACRGAPQLGAREVAAFEVLRPQITGESGNRDNAGASSVGIAAVDHGHAQAQVTPVAWMGQ